MSSAPDGRRLETPRAAGVAGLAFAALFVDLDRAPAQPSRQAGARRRRSGDFYLRQSTPAASRSSASTSRPFSGIAFLWFIAVVRNLIGDREDRFFSTVFLGSGLLFVAMLFVAAGLGGALLAAVKFNNSARPLAPETIVAVRALALRVPLHLRHADGRRLHDRRLHHRHAPRRLPALASGRRAMAGRSS